MPKELLAGAEEHSQVPLEWIGDKAHPVAITQFDYAPLDTYRELLKEELLASGSPERCIRAQTEQIGRAFRVEITAWLFDLIRWNRRPGLAAVQLGFATRQLLTGDKTAGQWALEYSITPATFRRGVHFYERAIAAKWEDVSSEFAGSASERERDRPRSQAKASPPEQSHSELLDRDGLVCDRDGGAPLVNGELKELERLFFRIITSVLGIVLKKKKAGLAMMQLASAAGLLAVIETPGPAHAREFGISKQAVDEGKNSFKRSLGLGLARNDRDDAAKAKMQASNFRHRKFKEPL